MKNLLGEIENVKIYKQYLSDWRIQLIYRRYKLECWFVKHELNKKNKVGTDVYLPGV